MTNFPYAVPAGMEQSVHAYFGVWAIADIQADGLRGLARNLDVSRHLLAQAEQRMRVRAGDDPVGPDDEKLPDNEDNDEEQNVDDPRDAGKANAKHAGILAALPGLEVASNFDGFITADGIAVIEARGTLMKFSSSFSAGTSTVTLRRSIRAAKADARVRGIMGIFDSPGGTVAGTAELADEIAAAAAVKPLWMYGEDLLASAAYWSASGATRIAANRTAMVGSLGTVMVLYDMSKAFADAGVEPKVYRSGDGKRSRKAAGSPGTEISEEDDKYFQSLIDESNTHFRASVEQGRPKADAKTGFAEAAVYMAARAKTLGLIDEVCSFESYYDAITKSVGPPPAGRRGASARAEHEPIPEAQVDDAPRADQSVVDEPVASTEGTSMATATPNPTATTPAPAAAAPATPPARATLDEIEAGCPGATSDFIVAQLKSGATLDQARTAHMQALNAQIASLKTQGQATAAAAPVITAVPAASVPVDITPPAAKVATGVALVPTKQTAKTSTESTVAAELHARATEMSATRKITAQQATQRILASDEDLRERYVAEQTANSEAVRGERLARLAVGSR